MGIDLREAVIKAISDTRETLIQMYSKNNQYVSTDEITSSRDNKLKALAFIKYIPCFKEHMNDQWIIHVFNKIHNTSNEDFVEQCDELVGLLKINENIPKTLAIYFRRGLRIFLLALWRNRAILLPMSFSLPASSKGIEFCSNLYSEVLAIYRKPFIAHELDVTDISDAILPRSRRNFDWYNWRPIIASDWHTLEDINNEDLIKLFSELDNQKKKRPTSQSLPSYPVSPTALLQPLLEIVPDRCNFDLQAVAIHNPIRCQTPDILSYELSGLELCTSHKATKQIWLSYQGDCT